MTRLRSVSAIVVLSVLMAFGVGACGGSATKTPTSAGGGVSSSSAGAGGSAAPAGQCASAGTRHFEKTRLVADLGLAYGAFHRYLYKPYQAGAFKKGASGRTLAIIKATAAGVAIGKLMKNAAANAQADPTLCKYTPSMSTISTAIGGLTGQLTGGGATAAGGLASAEGLFAKLKSTLGFTAGSTSLPGLG